jgi:hypothetical protein
MLPWHCTGYSWDAITMIFCGLREKKALASMWLFSLLEFAVAYWLSAKCLRMGILAFPLLEAGADM